LVHLQIRQQRGGHLLQQTPIHRLSAMAIGHRND